MCGVQGLRQREARQLARQEVSPTCGGNGTGHAAEREEPGRSRISSMPCLILPEPCLHVVDRLKSLTHVYLHPTSRWGLPSHIKPSQTPTLCKREWPTFSYHNFS